MVFIQKGSDTKKSEGGSLHSPLQYIGPVVCVSACRYLGGGATLLNVWPQIELEPWVKNERAALDETKPKVLDVLF